MARKQYTRIGLILGPLALCATGTTQADVTLQERIAVDGSGIMSLANMSGTSTTSISGKRSRIESDMRMESGLARMVARGMGPAAEIVRLDEDKVIELDLKNNQYREVALADRRAQLAKATEQAREAQAKQPAPTGMDESQCEWSEPQVEVTRPGGKATIAGFEAEQVTVLAKQSCKDRKSGAVCDIALSLEEWVSPGFDAGQEALDFSMAYAKQMGLGESGRDVTKRAEALFGRYKEAWSKVAAEMGQIKGYPVKTSFAFGMGGPACTDSKSAQGTDSGTTSGARSAGGLAGEIAGAIFGRKKKQEESTASASAPTSAPAGMADMIVPLRVTAELLSVSRNKLEPGTFEVPAGFRKAGE